MKLLPEGFKALLAPAAMLPASTPSDPSSAWTAKATERVQFGYGLNYLIDLEHAIIVDVEATPTAPSHQVRTRMLSPAK